MKCRKLFRNQDDTLYSSMYFTDISFNLLLFMDWKIIVLSLLCCASNNNKLIILFYILTAQGLLLCLYFQLGSYLKLLRRPSLCLVFFLSIVAVLILSRQIWMMVMDRINYPVAIYAIPCVWYYPRLHNIDFSFATTHNLVLSEFNHGYDLI